MSAKSMFVMKAINIVAISMVMQTSAIAQNNGSDASRSGTWRQLDTTDKSAEGKDNRDLLINISFGYNRFSYQYPIKLNNGKTIHGSVKGESVNGVNYKASFRREDSNGPWAYLGDCEFGNETGFCDWNNVAGGKNRIEFTKQNRHVGVAGAVYTEGVKAYDGTAVAGRAANFDILGIKLNMPIATADQILLKQGYSCRDDGYNLNYYEKIQSRRSQRDKTIASPKATIPTRRLCLKTNAANITLNYIGSPSGTRVFQVRMAFDTMSTDWEPLKQRVVAKYGASEKTLYWCDGVTDIFGCQVASLVLNEGPVSHDLRLSMPQSYLRDIDTLVDTQVELLSPKNAGSDF